MLETDKNILLYLGLFYCLLSWCIFIERLMYFIRCLIDKKYRSKQPVLWKSCCIKDMILSLTLIWLPLIIIKTILEIFEEI
jgi:hypothetical protein